MSKAKELATQLKKHLDVYSAEIQSDYSEALIYSLINAVLSEPEPLKGWIEIEYHNSPTAFLPITQIMVSDWGHGKCSVVPISFLNSERYNSSEFMTVESYDSIKQKIKEAS